MQCWLRLLRLDIFSLAGLRVLNQAATSASLVPGLSWRFAAAVASASSSSVSSSSVMVSGLGKRLHPRMSE